MASLSRNSTGNIAAATAAAAAAQTTADNNAATIAANTATNTTQDADIQSNTDANTSQDADIQSNTNSIAATGDVKMVPISADVTLTPADFAKGEIFKGYVPVGSGAITISVGTDIPADAQMLISRISDDVADLVTIQGVNGLTINGDVAGTLDEPGLVVLDRNNDDLVLAAN